MPKCHFVMSPNNNNNDVNAEYDVNADDEDENDDVSFSGKDCGFLSYNQIHLS